VSTFIHRNKTFTSDDRSLHGENIPVELISQYDPALLLLWLQSNFNDYTVFNN